MKSLERQIVLMLAALLLLAFSLLLWVSVYSVKSLSDAYVLTRLEHDAEALLSALAPHRQGGLRLREGRIMPVYQQPLSGHYYQFSFADGKTINSRSLWDQDFRANQIPRGSVQTYRMQGPADQALIIRSAGYEKAGQQFTLTVAEDTQALSDEILYFQVAALLLLIITVIVIILLQRYVLRRGFRMLDQVRDDVRLVATGQLQQLQTLGPAEIRPLTQEINRLLQQLQQRLRRSRDALGNLAHALKSPLSLMTQTIDRLDLDEPQRRELSANLSRISILIDRELKRARLAGGETGRHFNLSRDVGDLLAALKQLYRERQLHMTADIPDDVTLPFDREDMLELLGNLLDNACKWAGSEIGLHIRLNASLVIEVADNGQGVSDDQISLLMQRGTRIDENQQGSGLGLAIVNDLVTDYAGEISFKRSPLLGGLLVTVSLPLPADNL